MKKDSLPAINNQANNPIESSEGNPESLSAGQAEEKSLKETSNASLQINSSNAQAGLAHHQVNNEDKSREESHKSKGGKDDNEVKSEESKSKGLNNKGANQDSKILAPLPAYSSNNTAVEERKSQYKRTPVRTWGCRASNLYVFEKCIGAGTYGRVYKARLKHPQTKEESEEEYAIKMFKLDGEKEGFPITSLREVSFLKKLNHPNIIGFKEIVTDKGK